MIDKTIASSALPDQQSVEESFDSLLGDVAGEFFERMTNGERPDIEEYVARYPQLAEQIRSAFPALQLVGDSRAESLGQRLGEVDVTRSQTLGDFRILNELGRGGMGVVYEAEQLSMGRRVALKVLPFAALAQEKSLQRFRNEVRAAGSLNHPNIVQIHSVGEERGVHFFAMQLIRGQTMADVIAQLASLQSDGRPLTGDSISDALSESGGPKERTGDEPTVDSRPLADDAAPSEPRQIDRETEARISTEGSGSSRTAFARSAARLGIQAAEALQHAHDQGVLHRDIKPGNLMLDAEAQLYVADFGLARIDSDVGVTMTGDLIGTLRYMSPEQALAKRVVIDERSDIYSLGVTLYELLTLRPPFDGANRQELLKQIAFDDPAKPRQLIRSIPIDLETIVLKAIEKNPDDRYGSAQELADDLRAFLEHRPIKARPPSPAARVSKWLKRHPAFVVSAIAVMLIATCVSTVAAVMVMRENDAKQDALVDARQAQDETEAVLQFLIQDLLRAASPEKYPGKQITVADVLEEAEQRIDNSFVDRPLIEARIREILGLVRHDLGQFELARDHHERTLKIRQQHLGAEHFATLESMNSLGIALFRLREYTESRSLLERALQLRGRVLGDEHPKTLATMLNLANVLTRQGDLAAAHDMATQVVELRRKGPLTHQTAYALNNLGVIDKELGDFESAKARTEEALEIYQKTLGLNHPAALSAMHNRANLLDDLGDKAGALLVYKQVLEGKRQVLGPDHPETIKAIRSTSVRLAQLGDVAAARDLDLEGLEAARKRFGDNDWQVAQILNRLGWWEKQDGNLKAARAYYEEAIRGQRLQAKQSNRLELVKGLSRLGEVFQELREFDQAYPCLLEVIEVRRQLLQEAPNDPSMATLLGGAYCNLGALYGRTERYADALPELEEAIAILSRVVAHQPRYRMANDFLVNSMKSKAQVCRQLGRFEEAIAVYDELLEVADKGRHTEILTNQAVAYASSGDSTRTLEILEKVLAQGELTGRHHYSMACAYSLAGAVAEKNQTLPAAERDRLVRGCSERTMQSLRASDDAGYFDSPNRLDLVDSDSDLDWLRQSHEFQEFADKVKARANRGTQ